MSTIGIIAEYNPFHNGHAFHIKETRAKTGADTIVAIMSGNYTQRGEVAIFDKYARAAVALNYVDLVAELPVSCSLGSAQMFATGGVQLAAALKCDGISFGSECGDVELLRKAAKAAFYSEQKPEFFNAIKRGMTYPAALSYMVGRSYGEDVTAVFTRPNDTLAVEYIKAADLYAPGMREYAVERYAAEHNSDLSVGDYASGSYLRKMIVEGCDTSAFAPENYSRVADTAGRNENSEIPGADVDYAHVVRLEKAILAFYRTTSVAETENYQCMTRELAARIISAARLARNLNELHCLAKTKCYTMARIRRAVMCGFLRIDKDLSHPPYIHILGMNGRGKAVLKNALLPADTSLANLEALSGECGRFARVEARCGDVYALCFTKPRASGGDYRAKPCITA